MPTFTAENLRLMFVNAMVLGMVSSLDGLLTGLVSHSLTRTNYFLIQAGGLHAITGCPRTGDRLYRNPPKKH